MSVPLLLLRRFLILSDELTGWISDPENAASRAVRSHTKQTPDNPTGNAVCFLVYDLGSDRGSTRDPLKEATWWRGVE